MMTMRRPSWIELLTWSVAAATSGAVNGAEVDHTAAAPPGYTIIQEDIQIPVEWLDRPSSTWGNSTTWPNGVVPYEFDANTTQANRDSFVVAMTYMEGYSGVDFRPRVGGDVNWVHVQNAGFNNSAVGVQGGQQVINIVSWGSRWIMIHELMHALGIWHEQSRTDRGTYVTINYANICQSGCCFDSSNMSIPCDFNFNITPMSNNYGPYDFDSVMHYNATAFTSNGLSTITINEPWASNPNTPVIGQRSHVSYYDRFIVRALYPYSSDRHVNTTQVHNSQGRFIAPWNLGWPYAMANMPAGGTLFLDDAGYHSAIGTYTKAMTVIAPQGATLGN
jgi:astacin